MKKIFLFIAITFSCIQVQAQEKAEPTKEETFKFIMYMLGENTVDYTWELGHTLLKGKVTKEDINSNFLIVYERYYIISPAEISYWKNGEIKDKTLDNGIKYLETHTMYFKDLMEVNRGVTLNLKFKSNYSLYCYSLFAENLTKDGYFGDCSLSSTTSKVQNFEIKMKSEEDADKLEKALNHWIKLMGNKVNTSLFDE